MQITIDKLKKFLKEHEDTLVRAEVDGYLQSAISDLEYIRDKEFENNLLSGHIEITEDEPTVWNHRQLGINA